MLTIKTFNLELSHFQILIDHCNKTQKQLYEPFLTVQFITSKITQSPASGL